MSRSSSRERQLRHELARRAQQPLFARDDRIWRERFDGVRAAAIVFDDRQPGDDRHALHQKGGDLADDRFVADARERGVIARRANGLAQADRRHLEQAALDRAGEVGVRLHAADDDDRVGTRGARVACDRDAVRGGRADFHDVHLALDRRTGAAFADTQVRQHRALSLAGAAAVRPHCRDQERRRPRVAHRIARTVQNRVDARDAAAARSDGNARARAQRGAREHRCERFARRCGDIADRRNVEGVADEPRVHRGHRRAPFGARRRSSSFRTAGRAPAYGWATARPRSRSWASRC